MGSGPLGFSSGAVVGLLVEGVAAAAGDLFPSSCANLLSNSAIFFSAALSRQATMAKESMATIAIVVLIFIHSLFLKTFKIKFSSLLRQGNSGRLTKH